MKVLAAFLLYGVFFGLVEIVTAKSRLSHEVSRKAVHILGGLAAAALAYVLSFHEIAILSLLFVPVMLLSKRRNILSSIHEVKRTTYGEVYFPVSIALTALLFPDKSLYIYGVLVMSVSDGLASIIGQRFRSRKYAFLWGRKSYFGSLAFFVSTLMIGCVVMLASGTGLVPAFLLSVFMASVLTVIEAGMSAGFDNLILPPAAAGLFLLLTKLFSLA